MNDASDSLPELPVSGSWCEATGLWQGRFSGHAQFAELVRTALRAAIERNWSEITVCDADFAAWPFAYRDTHELLQQWSQTGRRFTILAHGYRHIEQNQHRFVQWRRRWSHIIEARSLAQLPAADFPSLMLTPEWVCRRTQTEFSIGHAGDERWRRVAVREQLQELLAQSAPAWPATTLGL